MSAAGPSGTLIVGASHAGVQLAVTLRDEGYEDPITLVTEEPHLPYQRPPLSKSYLLDGQVTAESIALRASSFYEERSITLLRSAHIHHIDHEQRTAVTAAGAVLTYEHLALTVGAATRRLKVPGADGDKLLYLRDMHDADKLAKSLEGADKVLVIGGGFIGLEAAAAATQLGKDVVVVDTGVRLMQRSVSPAMSAHFKATHEAAGSRVLLGRSVTEVINDETGTMQRVRLDDGQVIDAQLVVIGIGVEPRTELATDLGLHVDRGIVVDDFARTSIESIVAAGDCTVFEHHQRPGVRAGLESVQNASDQARVAALTLLGRENSYHDVPWFWSDQGPLKLQIAGLVDAADNFVVRGEPEVGPFSVIHFAGTDLVAVEAVNRPADYMAVRRALANNRTMDRSLVHDIERPLKTLLSPTN